MTLRAPEWAPNLHQGTNADEVHISISLGLAFSYFVAAPLLVFVVCFLLLLFLKRQ